MNASNSRSWSLQQRLTLALFSLVLVLWTLSAAVIYVQAEKESQELFDTAIAETASLLLFISEHELLEVGHGDVSGQDYIEKSSSPQYLSFQLWDNNGVLRYRSANAPKTPLAPLNEDGFGWQNTHGELTRTYNLMHSDGMLRIIVSEPLKHRQEISSHFFGGLFLFSLFLLPLGYVAVRWIVSRAFRPVERSVEQVNTLDTKNLNPLKVEGVPREITPLLQALNSALHRIQEGIAREKRFTADAAHELRTPLAGVKANIQLLQKLSMNQDDIGHDVMCDTLQGVDRCSRMINQLLALSRSDAMAVAALPAEILNLQEIIEDVFQLERSHAESRSVLLTSNILDRQKGNQIPGLEHLTLRGYPTAIELLVRNLVNNAITYNKPGGKVEVSVQCPALSPGSTTCVVRIEVKDNGPGIPPEVRERVFNRFFRASPGHAKGSGLGLSICKEVAQLHDTNIEVGPGIEGQGVSFSFELRGEQIAKS